MVTSIRQDEKTKYFVWIDIETTGLKAPEDKLLEIAVVLTDKRMKPIAHYISLCNGLDGFSMSAMNPFVKKMHEANGLFKDILLMSEGIRSLSEIDNYLIELFIDNGLTTDLCVFHPAGSSVHFDVEFISHFLPKFSSYLDHRHLDLSSVKLFLQQRKKGFTYKIDPILPKHRAINDILTDIKFARKYLKKV